MSITVIITGGNPRNLAVTLTGNSTAQVSWTAPDGPPSGGYRILIAGDGNNPDMPTSSTSETFVLTPGRYDIRVMVVSQHLPGMVGPRQIDVLGEGIFFIHRMLFKHVLCRCPKTSF